MAGWAGLDQKLELSSGRSTPNPRQRTDSPGTVIGCAVGIRGPTTVLIVLFNGYFPDP